jgi:hypothetical protein
MSKVTSIFCLIMISQFDILSLQNFHDLCRSNFFVEIKIQKIRQHERKIVFFKGFFCVKCQVLSIF